MMGTYHPRWQIPGAFRSPVLVKGEPILLAFEVGQRVEREEIVAYIEFLMSQYSPFGEGPQALRHVLCDLKDGKHLVRAEKLRKAAVERPAKRVIVRRPPKRRGLGRHK